MSDQSQGPGWWQASDGRWFAPESHPNVASPTSVGGPPGITPPLPPVDTQTPYFVAATPAPSNSQAPEVMVIGSRQSSSPNVPRRGWVWAVPVIAGALALAIVLPLTLGGTSRAATPAQNSSAGSRGISGSYIGIGIGPQPLFLTLVETGTSFSGSISGPSFDVNHPDRLTSISVKMTGTVEGSKLKLVAKEGGQLDSGTGTISGTSVTIDFVQGGSVVFKPGTIDQFNRLVSLDRKSLLAQGASFADRAAESNLTNALTEAKALYQVTQSYSTNGQPYGAPGFTTQAPEFTWTTGSCGATPANCVSFHVMDVSTGRDAQGLALATYSSGSSTCWYATDIESTPVVLPNDASAFKSTSHSANSSVMAGSFYARSPVGSAPTSCNASLVLHAHHAAWGDSYATAGALS